MEDYEVIGVDQGEDVLTHFALFSDRDPTTFEVAIKESKWKKAMDAEIATIEKMILGSYVIYQMDRKPLV